MRGVKKGRVKVIHQEGCSQDSAAHGLIKEALSLFLGSISYYARLVGMKTTFFPRDRQSPPSPNVRRSRPL